MPARPALAPWGIPRGFPRLFCFPQREVPWIVLVLAKFLRIPSPNVSNFLLGLAAKPAIVLEFRHGKIHAAVLSVGKSSFFQVLDELDHGVDEMRRPWGKHGRFYVELVHGELILGNVLLGQLENRDSPLGSSSYHLVINVREIAR